MADQAPDPARIYERAKPEAESGMGRLDNNANATPTKRSDKMEQAVSHRQPARQINAETEPSPQGPRHAPSARRSNRRDKGQHRKNDHS